MAAEALMNPSKTAIAAVLIAVGIVVGFVAWTYISPAATK